jgi:hypothetical protein
MEVAGFFARRAFRKEVMARVNAMLLFYPGGVRNVARNYPNLPKAIDGNCDAGDIKPGHSAVIIAGSILANEFMAVDPVDREAMRQQLGRVDFAQFKEVLRGNGQMPKDMAGGTAMAALAFIMAETELNKGGITEDQFKSFMSEVWGALEGKDADQRSSERVRDIIDETLGPPPLRDGDDDNSAVYPSQHILVDMPEFNGTECKVRIVYTATGFALVQKEDNVEIRERRSLTQEDLEKVKREDWDNCRYVNLHTRGGEIVSCLIVGEDSEIIGSPRAFWWALAKVSVKMTDVSASGVRMSVHALARIHTEARAMWDTVVERSRSIEELREEPMYARNIHLNVLSKMIDEAQSEAGKLGLEICKAMVLATQAEDDKLEAYAYQRFKRFLWRPGEEPREFYTHDARAA